MITKYSPIPDLFDKFLLFASVLVFGGHMRGFNHTKRWLSAAVFTSVLLVVGQGCSKKMNISKKGNGTQNQEAAQIVTDFAGAVAGAGNGTPAEILAQQEEEAKIIGATGESNLLFDDEDDEEEI